MTELHKEAFRKRKKKNLLLNKLMDGWDNWNVEVMKEKLHKEGGEGGREWEHNNNIDVNNDNNNIIMVIIIKVGCVVGFLGSTSESSFQAWS